jgi:hypothetical protein
MVVTFPLKVTGPYEIIHVMKLFFLILVFTQLVHAQYSEQPQKESSTDLRNQSVLFSIEDVSSKKTFWLERTQSMDYFLRMKESGEDDTIKKVDSGTAKKLDMDFASRFLKCQYEIEEQKGECKVTLRLSMKGETQDLCGKDDKKTQEITPFLKNLTKQF